MADFPNNVYNPATKTNGQTIQASWYNDPDAEIAAIEDGYLNGTARLNSSNSTVAALSVSGGSTFTGNLTAASTGVAIGSSSAPFGSGFFSALEVAGASVSATVGTWTPVIGGAGGTSGQTYAADGQVGKYVKFGQFVFVSFRAALSVEGTITGAVEIQGLPFTTENTTNLYSVATIEWFQLATTWVNITGQIAPNTTAITLKGATAAAASNVTDLSAADIQNNSLFIGSAMYIAAP